VANGAGTVTADVTDVQISCSATAYTVGGVLTVDYTDKKTIILENNRVDDLTLNETTSFTFPTALALGAGYAVTVKEHPDSVTCEVTNGTGTISGNVMNIEVNCVTVPLFTLGGTLSGLAEGRTVVLNNMGKEWLTLTQNGPISFRKQMYGSAFGVIVETQPEDQDCEVTNGNGTVSGDVTDILVQCTMNQFTVGGTLAGLASGASVVLANGGNDFLTLIEDGHFVFDKMVAKGSSYDVTVSTLPGGQYCSVAYGTGEAISADVTDIKVTCAASANQYTVGGSLSGLAVSKGILLVLQDNGGDDLPVSSNGPFIFQTALAKGANYDVTVMIQPEGQYCEVTQGSGGPIAANVTDVEVGCQDLYRIGGTLTGVSEGGEIVLQNNGCDDLSLTAKDDTFTFSTGLPYGAHYEVTVKSPPQGQSCEVINGSGTISDHVMNVQVICVTPTPTFSVGGIVTGLSDRTDIVTLQNNQGDNITVNGQTQGGIFTFPTRLQSGATYDVTVMGLSTMGKSCTVQNGHGTIGNANITSVSVTCS
jgi:hypothetical protein